MIILNFSSTAQDPVEPLLHWLRERAWPLWLAHGIDRPRRAFHEHLSLTGYGCSAPFRRLRVAARQTYVFACAQRAGLAGADDALELGLDFLQRHARQDDGGYAWRFDLANRVIDARRDLYDHAFVLLALSAAHQAAPGRALKHQALQLHDYLGVHFTHPAGGFRESLPDALPRRQNPHMHLLEACLAAAEAFGDGRFLERADQLVACFLASFWDARTGTLVELLDTFLQPQDLPAGRVVEPGHHCEWVWLLDWYLSLRPVAPLRDRLLAVAAALAEFAERHGADPITGGLLDGISILGLPLQPTARIWPQAERLKSASLAGTQMNTALPAAVAGLTPYLRADGLWHERRQADRSWSDEPAPASSLYHLTCAILHSATRAANGPESGPNPLT